MLSSEKVLTFYKPQLSDYLNSEIADKRFFLSTEGWYYKNDIQVTLGVRVENIDKNNKVVKLSNELSYDKLILATGASNFLPPIKVFEKQGVYTIRSIDDAQKVKKE